MVLSGNINFDHALALSQKWFGPVERRKISPRNLPAEPPQKEERILNIEKDVPADAIYKVWHTGPRNSPDHFTLDLITDLLAGGESGRLYTKLVREKKMFSEINAYITSDIDPGLIIVQGKLMKGIKLESAEKAIIDVITELESNKDLNEEMEKVKNKFESSSVFSNTSILNKAVSLAYYELMGNAELVNKEVDLYRKVSQEMVTNAIKKYFIPSNCSTLYYKSTRTEKQ
jgi:predicted Zn-dependent peptidase